MREAHNSAIDDWDASFEDRQRFEEAGIGDEFEGWMKDLKRMRNEQNILDAMSDEYSRKGEAISLQRGKMMTKKKAYEEEMKIFDGLLFKAQEKIVLPNIDQDFKHIPNWEGYKLPSREWCIWMDSLEDYMKKKHNDPDMLVHKKKKGEWFKKMHPDKEAIDTFYPPEPEPEPVPEPESAEPTTSATTTAAGLKREGKGTLESLAKKVKK